MPEVTFVPHNDVAALRAAFSNDVCAICIEVIQGEGGINPISARVPRQVARELCDSTGALLLFDEIQSGMGRTGKWCAYQHFNIKPDVTTLAKPLAGGIPMGAMLCTEEAARAITPGMHGTTFGGNPLACAVAIAVVDAIKHDRPPRPRQRSPRNYFLAQLKTLQSKHPEAIKEVRGLGLMLGVEIAIARPRQRPRTPAMLSNAASSINRTHETVLRFLPPYLITQSEHVDQAITAIDELLTQHEASNSTKPPKAVAA